MARSECNGISNHESGSNELSCDVKSGSGWKSMGASSLAIYQSVVRQVRSVGVAHWVRSFGSVPSHLAMILYSTSARSTPVRPLTPMTPTEREEQVGGISSPWRAGLGISNEKGNWPREFEVLRSGMLLLRSTFSVLTVLANASRMVDAERGLLLSPVV